MWSRELLDILNCSMGYLHCLAPCSGQNRRKAMTQSHRPNARLGYGGWVASGQRLFSMASGQKHAWYACDCAVQVRPEFPSPGGIRNDVNLANPLHSSRGSGVDPDACCHVQPRYVAPFTATWSAINSHLAAGDCPPGHCDPSPCCLLIELWRLVMLEFTGWDTHRLPRRDRL